MTGGFLHDLLVEIVDEIVAVGTNGLVRLLEGLVGGLVAHRDEGLRDGRGLCGVVSRGLMKAEV